MLVLTRKTGEEIQIGDDITIKVSEITGNRAKICIDAPKLIRILRGEVAAQIEEDAKHRDIASSSTAFDTRSLRQNRAVVAAK